MWRHTERQTGTMNRVQVTIVSDTNALTLLELGESISVTYDSHGIDVDVWSAGSRS